MTCAQAGLSPRNMEAGFLGSRRRRRSLYIFPGMEKGKEKAAFS